VEEKALNRKDREESAAKNAKQTSEFAFLRVLCGFPLRPLRLKALSAFDDFVPAFPTLPRLKMRQ
jgi:hypothetical protein